MTKLVEKISFRNIMVLMSAAMILLMLAGSAMAAGSLTSKWSDNNNADFELNESRSLIYTIGSLPAGTYELEITLANTDGSYSDSGFEILGYTGSDEIPESYANILKKENIEISTDKMKLKYTLENPGLMSLDVLIYANGKLIYPDEEVRITAVLKEKGGAEKGTVVQSIACKLPTFGYSSAFFLLNPAEMPIWSVVTNLINVSYRPATDATGNLYTTRGMTVPVKDLTLDLSNVKVKYYDSVADVMVTDTYANLIAASRRAVDPVESPVEFLDKAGNPLGDDNKLVLGDMVNFHANSFHYFSFKINENFTNNGDTAPEIIFVETVNGKRIDYIQVSGDLSVNRGKGIYQFGSTLFNPVTSPANLKGSTDTKVWVRPLAGILSNSVQYGVTPDDPRAHLYTQDLFKVQITDSTRDGSDMVVTVTLPDGVNITHMRLPRETVRNNDVQYDSIKIYDNVSGSFKPMSNYISSSHSSDTAYLVNFTEYGFDPVFTDNGERVIQFEFEKFLKTRLALSSADAFTATNGLTFIGTTTNVKTDGSAKVKVETSTGASNESALSMVTTPDKYPLTSYIGGKGRELLVNNDAARSAITSPMLKGETYILRTNFSTSSYPYYSAHRTDPLSPSPTNTLSNPVVYFSLPKGFAAGTPTITYNGVSTDLKDIQNPNRSLTFETKEWSNAGVYGEGGSLVEVKLVLDGTYSDENFWVKTGTYVVELPVTLSPLMTDESVSIKNTTILVGTWDPKALSVGVAGSNGNTVKLTDAGLDFSAVSATTDNGMYAQHMIDRSFSINTEKMTDVSVYVETATGYVSYNPSNPNSYLKLHAGSKNEVFHMVMKGGSDEGPVTNNAAYFVIPQGEWNTVLNDDFVLNTDMDKASVEVYYATVEINPKFIGDTDEYNLSFFESIADEKWTKIDFTDVVAGREYKSNLDTTTLNSITIVKCKFFLADSDETFDLSMPFMVPRATEGATYGTEEALIRGHTAFSFGVPISISKDNSNTPAIERIKSTAPVVKFVTAKNTGELTLSEIGTSFSEIAVETGSIPNWWDIAVSDDVSDVTLNEIAIRFSPARPGDEGREKTITSFVGDNTVYSEYGVTGGLDWKYLTVSDSDKSFVTLVPGTYSFTYKTSLDDDLQIDSKTIELVITKENKISLTNQNFEDFQDSSKADNPVNEFKKLILASATDGGSSISGSDLIHILTTGDEDEFGWNIPGKYIFTYSYTDVGNNMMTATVDVTIKYKGTLTLKPVLQTGSADLIESIVFDVNDGTADLPVTFVDGKYTAELKATAAKPKQVDYTVSLTSYPTGLVKPDTLPSGTAGTVSGSSMVPSPSEEVIFTPAQFTVETDGAGVETLTLMKVGAGGDPDEEIETKSIYGTAADTIVFAPEDGEWFEDGDYYMIATFLPGYGIGASSDFSESGGVFETTAVTLNSADVEWNCNIEKTPLVSGIAWNDTNKNSLMDDGEGVLSDVEVELWYNDGTDWTIVGTTATNDTGYYRFYEDLEEGAYYIKVNVLSGYQLSEFVVGGAQVIHKDSDNCSEEFNLDGNDGMWNKDMHIGLYKTENNGNGNGYGQAYVVYSTSGGTVLVEGPEGDVIEPGFERPVDAAEDEENDFPWLFIVLVIGGILVFLAVFYSEFIKKEKN
ncbi:hypothetical protein MmiAt1_01440 [Methanimicrococcus sp. At1]|uniref:SD-repeat containing protein B domain-containing protein n=1 Tax=Methanimicrococcus hacksteinii TaxID=3028293 RepID=A0ABU3VMI5_9EURY|nr:SdrD B-like domain-containing protein [Methanimicrococcus sp. At1]MDV0444614.1 hypothetical protein [Methanimicrococcus sp. At1]